MPKTLAEEILEFDYPGPYAELVIEVQPSWLDIDDRLDDEFMRCVLEKETSA